MDANNPSKHHRVPTPKQKRLSTTKTPTSGKSPTISVLSTATAKKVSGGVLDEQASNKVSGEFKMVNDSNTCFGSEGRGLANSLLKPHAATNLPEQEGHRHGNILSLFLSGSRQDIAQANSSGTQNCGLDLLGSVAHLCESGDDCDGMPAEKGHGDASQAGYPRYENLSVAAVPSPTALTKRKVSEEIGHPNSADPGRSYSNRNANLGRCTKKMKIVSRAAEQQGGKQLAISSPRSIADSREDTSTPEKVPHDSSASSKSRNPELKQTAAPEKVGNNRKDEAVQEPSASKIMFLKKRSKLSWQDHSQKTSYYMPARVSLVKTVSRALQISETDNDGFDTDADSSIDEEGAVREEGAVLKNSVGSSSNTSLSDAALIQKLLGSFQTQQAMTAQKTCTTISSPATRSSIGALNSQDGKPRPEELIPPNGPALLPQHAQQQVSGPSLSHLLTFDPTNPFRCEPLREDHPAPRSSLSRDHKPSHLHSLPGHEASNNPSIATITTGAAGNPAKETGGNETKDGCGSHNKNDVELSPQSASPCEPCDISLVDDAEPEKASNVPLGFVNNSPTKAFRAQQESKRSALEVSAEQARSHTLAFSRSEQVRTYLPGSPQAMDVESFKGNQTAPSRSEGNKLFRELVHKCRESFSSTNSRRQKTSACREVVQSVIRVGGRFVKREPTGHRYFLLTEREAMKKTSKALNDASKFASSKKTTKTPQPEEKEEKSRESSCLVNNQSSELLSPLAVAMGEPHQSPSMFLHQLQSRSIHENAFTSLLSSNVPQQHSLNPNPIAEILMLAAVPTETAMPSLSMLSSPSFAWDNNFRPSLLGRVDYLADPTWPRANFAANTSGNVSSQLWALLQGTDHGVQVGRGIGERSLAFSNFLSHPRRGFP